MTSESFKKLLKMARHKQGDDEASEACAMCLYLLNNALLASDNGDKEGAAALFEQLAQMLRDTEIETAPPEVKHDGA
jgi:hypothetical protein